MRGLVLAFRPLFRVEAFALCTALLAVTSFGRAAATQHEALEQSQLSDLHSKSALQTTPKYHLLIISSSREHITVSVILLFSHSNLFIYFPFFFFFFCCGLQNTLKRPVRVA